MLRQEQCAHRREARVATLQARRELVKARVIAKALRLGQVLEPSCIATRRVGGIGGGEAKPFDVDKLRHPLGPTAGIERRYVAAHAVPDEDRWRARREPREQLVEI